MTMKRFDGSSGGRRRGRLIGSLAAGLFAAALPDPARAEDSPETARNEAAREILVTASRHADDAFDLPWYADTLTSREIAAERVRRTLPDAMLDLPGVMIQRTSYGQASPFVRGFTGYHTVLLIDGIRLNNSTFRSGPNQYWSTVDSQTADRLEVVRGPNSVLYGSDAVGGTVQMVTRRRTSFEPGFHLGGRILVRYASAEASHSERIEIDGNHGELGFLGGIAGKSFGDLRTGGSPDRQDGTGYREKDGDLRFDWRESDRSVWTLAWQHVAQNDVPRTHRTVDSVPFHGTAVGDELRRDLTQMRDLLWFRNARRIDAVLADDIEWTVSFHRQKESQVRDRDTTAPAKSDVQRYSVDTLGLQFQGSKDTSAGFVTWGAELWSDEVKSSRTNLEDGVKVLDTVQGPVADDASYDLLGIYAQDEFQLGSTAVTAGVRWTRAAADADRVDDPLVGGSDPATPGNVIGFDDSWDQTVGSLRAVHPVADGWNVFGGASQGFRAPNLSDLTRLDDTSGVETPSLDLDPERFLQFEAGVKGREGPWAVQAAVWRTRIRDLIVPSPTGALVGTTPEVRKDNVGDGWASGVEIEAARRFGESFTASLAGTWQDGEVDQLLPSGAKVRRPLSRMMPLTVAADLRWAEPGSNLALWASARFADAQDQLSLKDATDDERIPPGGTPGYGVLSLGAVWKVTDGATLSVVVDNLFDKDFRIHGSGVNEPGRSLVVALDLRF